MSVNGKIQNFMFNKHTEKLNVIKYYICSWFNTHLLLYILMYFLNISFKSIRINCKSYLIVINLLICKQTNYYEVYFMTNVQSEMQVIYISLNKSLKFFTLNYWSSILIRFHLIWCLFIFYILYNFIALKFFKFYYIRGVLNEIY